VFTIQWIKKSHRLFAEKKKYYLLKPNKEKEFIQFSDKAKLSIIASIDS